MRFDRTHWAVILGGSSGFGLASARKLAAHGMNLAIIHRDRRGAMKRIEPAFQGLRDTGVRLLTFNANALAGEERQRIGDALTTELGEVGRVRLLLHSIAHGNLKPLAKAASQGEVSALDRLAAALSIDSDQLEQAVVALFVSGVDQLHSLLPSPPNDAPVLTEENMAETIYNMGTSLFSWVNEILSRGLFADDARVLGLTSEGNTVAWRGYAAVSAAKVALESLSRSMALELAPHGVRTNIIQAGIAETPASSPIPGIDRMKAQARRRNPFGRLTRPEDVANTVFLMCLDESSWINGTIVRADGGEHISGDV